MELRRGWSEEHDGLWYRPPGGGPRSRGVWRICKRCSRRFPAVKHNPGTYCSHSCGGKVGGATNGIATRATRPDLFRESLTPSECWLAGVIWADGHLTADHRIVLNMADEDTIALCAKVAGCGYRTYLQSKAPRRPIHRLHFRDSGAVAALISLGMMQAKPMRGWPSPSYPASFLRGAFDADGSVSRRKNWSDNQLRSSLCGSVEFLKGAQKFLGGYRITPKKLQPRGGSVFVIEWGHHDSLQIADVMYSEPGPYMERKRHIFDQT